ncbi:MAG: M48 family metallopeptidase [Terracidiphilus sp.]
MKIGRKSLLAMLPFALLAGLASLPLKAQTAASAANPAQTTAAAPAQTAPQPAYSLPPDKLAKAIAISRIRNILNIAGSLWSIVFLWLLLAVGALAGVDHWTQGVAKRRWVQGLIFFAAFIVITTLAGLPFDWLGQHYERSYGISVQGWGSWLGDEGKSLGLALVFGVPILLLFNWVVKRWPRRYWLGIWVLTLPILVLTVFVEPLLVPLFYKQEPLQKHHAALVARMETVVARTGINIPPDRMYLIQASAKSKGINAFVAGIGATKRYVMWDTATDQMPDDEILFVFGHESGHYVLHHIPKILVGSALGMFFIYWACAALAAWLIARYGDRWGADGLASRTGFVVLLFAISLAGFVTEPASNAFSRYFEHQADVYGQEAIHGIVADPQKTAVAAFNKLGESWLEDPNPNPIIEFWLFNHPSVEHRAEFAEHYNPWANGGHGEFFKN